MRYQPANLLGGFYKDSSKPWSAQDTLNWIPEVAQAPGTRTEAKLRTAPGLKPFVEIGGNPIRGSHNCEGKLFVVSGNRLYQISNAGIAIPIGTVPGTGMVSMSHNQITGGNELVVVNGSAGYVYNTRTMIFQRISDPAFPGSIATDYLDQYILHVEPFGRYWFHSELADALNYNSLDRYESEASPDKIVTLKTNNLEVVVFNETTTEFFDNTGSATNTFQNKRAVIDVGAAGRFAVAKIDRSLIWLANDGVFYYLEGYNGRPISTPPIEQAISGFDWSRCIAKVYESEGHKIAYFTFPGGLTFGYDVVTQLWHRRGSFGMDRWRINSLTNWNRKYIAGDFQNGRLYELDWKYPLEADQPLVRERTSGVTSENQNRIFVPYAEVIVDTGQERVTPVPFPAQPIGPTITGDAPDGYIGQLYSYQYTITEGDAPVVAVTANKLPKGLTISSSGLLSGTLEEIGATDFTVRARDSNGLWDEASDLIKVGAPWALLKVQDPPTTQIWISPDPTSWPSESTISPFAPSPGFGTSNYFGKGVLVLPNSTGDAAIVGYPPISGVMESELIAMPPVQRTRLIDGLLFVFPVSGATYRILTESGSVQTVTSPGGGSIFDICRLDSDRWVCYSGLTGLVYYSDQEVPTTWTAGASCPDVVQSSGGFALGCDGVVILMPATLNRCYRVLEATTAELLTGSGDLYPDPRSSEFYQGSIVFGGQPVSPGNVILATSNRGDSFAIHMIEGLHSVERLDTYGDVLVASGQGNVTPSESLVYVCRGDLDVWEPSEMPYTVPSSGQAVVVSLGP